MPSAIGLSAESADPPGRIGRVSDFDGALHLATEDQQGEWGAVEINYPVTGGDELWVPVAGRAEIDFGTGAFRLAGDTQVRISRLDDRGLELYVARGQLILRLRSLEADEQAVVSTANAELRIGSPGTYRIEVRPGPASRWIVRDGEAELIFGRGSEYLGADRMADVEGEDGERVMLRQPPGVDGFEAWSIDRDRRIEASLQANAYVAPSMIGAHDLDAHGTWQQYPEYGAVWFPSSVGPEWAPYREGRWVWVAPWGWTWVDDARWGFAPFHYGRWVWVSGRWGWTPGHYEPRPVYAPALVAWYGGPDWSVGVTSGGPVYGWLPLGWGDPYWPQYRVSTHYWRSMNRPYAVNRAERRHAPPTRYANYRVPGAVTAVPGAVFRGRRPIPVSPNRVRVPESAWSHAPGLTAPPSIHKPMRVESAPRTGVALPPVVGPRPPPPQAAPRARDRSGGRFGGTTGAPLTPDRSTASPGAPRVAPGVPVPGARGPGAQPPRDARPEPGSRGGRGEGLPPGTPIGIPRGEVVVPRPTPEVTVPRALPEVVPPRVVPSASSVGVPPNRVAPAMPPPRAQPAPRFDQRGSAGTAPVAPPPAPAPRGAPAPATAPRVAAPSAIAPRVAPASAVAPQFARPAAEPVPRVARPSWSAPPVPRAASQPAPAAAGASGRGSVGGIPGGRVRGEGGAPPRADSGPPNDGRGGPQRGRN